MFWTAVGDVLTIALVIAINPPAIVAVILVLLGPQERAGGLLFLTGWFCGVLAVIALAYVLVEGVDDKAAVDDGVDLLGLAFGLLFWGLAALQWRKRPAPGEPAREPKALARVDSMSLPAVLALGLATAVLNIKTVPLAINAGAHLGQSGIEGGAAVAALIVVTLVASLGVLLPVAALLAGGERARPGLLSFKAWLLDNLAAIVIVVCLVIGTNMIGESLGLLS